MFRFQYYKGFIDLIDNNMLLELEKDIEQDYKNETLEPHQYEILKKQIYDKLEDNKILYI